MSLFTLFTSRMRSIYVHKLTKLNSSLRKDYCLCVFPCVTYHTYSRYTAHLLVAYFLVSLQSFYLYCYYLLPIMGQPHSEFLFVTSSQCSSSIVKLIFWKCRWKMQTSHELTFFNMKYSLCSMVPGFPYVCSYVSYTVTVLYSHCLSLLIFCFTYILPYVWMDHISLLFIMVYYTSKGNEEHGYCWGTSWADSRFSNKCKKLGKLFELLTVSSSLNWVWW